MAFWSSEKLHERLEPELVVDPFKPDRVKHGAYELCLGGEIIITSEKGVASQTWHTGYKPIIPSGQIAMLITEEKVNIPSDTIAFISIKATRKLGGLINISGFHVDPGFHGKLKFSVYNAGSDDEVLEVGQPTFMLWFCDLDRPTEDTYNGGYQGQDSMTAEDVRRLRGKIPSPQALSERIKALENKITYGIALMAAILVAIIGALVKHDLGL